MNPATGHITGTPTTDGNFTITATATAATSVTASASCTVVIAAAPPVLTSVSPAQGPDAGGTGIVLTGDHLTGATDDTSTTLSFDYRTAFGFDGNAQSHTFGIRVGGNSIGLKLGAVGRLEE